MQATQLATNAEDSSAASELTFLTFRLGSNLLGLPLDSVEEILRVVPTTPVPLTPPWLRGVFNLRGRVLPAVDLGVRLGFAASAATPRTCLLLLKMQVEGLEFTAGIIVDEVADLLQVQTRDIKPPPTMGVGLKVEFVRGIIEHNAAPLLFLDVIRVFSDDELMQLALTDQRTRNQNEQQKAAQAAAAKAAKERKAQAAAAAAAAEPAEEDLDWESAASDDCVHLFEDEE